MSSNLAYTVCLPLTCRFNFSFEMTLIKAIHSSHLQHCLMDEGAQSWAKAKLHK